MMPVDSALLAVLLWAVLVILALVLLVFKRRQFMKFVFSVFHAMGELCRHVEDMLDLVGKWCAKTVRDILMWGRRETPALPIQVADETESEARVQEETTAEGSVVVTFLFRVMVLVLSTIVLTCEFVL